MLHVHDGGYMLLNTAQTTSWRADFNLDVDDVEAFLTTGEEPEA